MAWIVLSIWIIVMVVRMACIAAYDKGWHDAREGLIEPSDRVWRWFV